MGNANKWNVRQGIPEKESGIHANKHQWDKERHTLKLEGTNHNENTYIS